MTCRCGTGFYCHEHKCYKTEKKIDPRTLSNCKIPKLYSIGQNIKTGGGKRILKQK